ncbi:hypothetical protein ACQRCQ_09340 [Lachnospiraceae bacterium SGI.085]
MKWIEILTKGSILVLCMVLLMGCGTDAEDNGDAKTQNIEHQIQGPTLENTQKEEQETEENQKTQENQPEDSSVDYDLTQMGSDMVYATVYQMMMTPEQYEGKTFRIQGSFHAEYYEPTQKYYEYCIIKDAMACCAQGLEFVWGDGTHTYPDEYPAENEEIMVEGTFGTYTEEGDTHLYCRLSDAELIF